MSQEYVVYKGIPSITTCKIQKQLELQQWIIDPSSRPSKGERLLISRSASTEIKEGKSNVQKQLELQRMIIADYP